MFVFQNQRDINLKQKPRLKNSINFKKHIKEQDIKTKAWKKGEKNTNSTKLVLDNPFPYRFRFALRFRHIRERENVQREKQQWSGFL